VAELWNEMLEDPLNKVGRDIYRYY